jgi:methionyl-tRNA formyltransferase
MRAELSNNRVVFFGTLGVFSRAALSLLVSKDVNVVAVVLAGANPGKANFEKHSLPIINQPQHATVEMLALEHNIPLLYVNEMEDEESIASLLSLNAEYYLVACFPFKLPSDVYQKPSVAALNIHPSILPAYRGPHPVFWQLKAGENKIGVTLHHIDSKWDSGDIVLQKKVAMKDGMRGRAIDTLVAAEGADLFIKAMRMFENNKVEPVVQVESDHSYFSQPIHADFELLLHWSSRQAFNFMRGTEEWGNNYQIKIEDKNIIVKSAMAYTPGGKRDEKYRIEANVAYIQFSPGVLQASVSG